MRNQIDQKDFFKLCLYGFIFLQSKKPFDEKYEKLMNSLVIKLQISNFNYCITLSTTNTITG